jgi:hypothetical protein
MVAAHPARGGQGTMPDTARIVFHQQGQIHVMDLDGGNVTQMTHGVQRSWEHAAVSYDRRFIAANEQLPNPAGQAGGNSRLWLFDLAAGTGARIAPRFLTAGNGGVDWDQDGFLYFAGKEANVVAQPRTTRDFIANAGANDIYRIRSDGTGLARIVATPDRGEADVSVSRDGDFVAFVSQPLGATPDRTEIWIAHTDGSEPRLVYRSGRVGVASAHDPELSPDNRQIVFSIVNAGVPPNFPDNPAANTAHDIYVISVDGTGLERITRPGPISIVPDWAGDTILYFEASEADAYVGASWVRPLGPDQVPNRIRLGAGSPKWIPSARE